MQLLRLVINRPGRAQALDRLLDLDFGLRDRLALPDGEAGEIWLRSPTLASGYWRNEAANAAFADGWFRTGDTGIVDGDGSIQLVGRQKSEINRAGIKISPEEVDLLLERHPDIEEVCTFGVADAISGELVAAAVRVASHVDEISPAELRTWCAQRIKRECIPERWYFVSEIPRTDRGKVNRDVVRQSCKS